MNQEVIDAMGAKVGAGMAYGGGGTAFVSGSLSLGDWGVITGIVVGVLGLAANIWFRWREDQRRVRHYEALRREFPR